MSSTPIKAKNKIIGRTPFYHSGNVHDPAWESNGVSKSSLLPIIAFCHLQWDWVWQRPQQFLSRLAHNRPVLFVETHRTNTWTSFVKVRDCHSAPNVTIMEVHLPSHRWDDGDFIDEERLRVVEESLKSEILKQFAGAILWFNDPMAVTAYAGRLNEALIVYDCMDELTQFQGAPPALAERERALTSKADVVFCGGRKMREKRLPLNPNTHFYGTGVDCPHFGMARLEKTVTDGEIQALPSPVLGYFGVVDERLDYELIAALADAFPQGSIVMVGPVAKVDPATLPRRPNLHWLGARQYAQLPAITKGFRVCLMPFALNASTEFINPTKALEYLAAGRPVVSTALDEVKSNCSAAVRIAKTHAEFIAMALEEASFPSPERIEAGLKLASENTWEAITSAMNHHIERTLAFKRSSGPLEPESANLSRELAMSGPLYV